MICDANDYAWARDVTAEHDLSARVGEVLFSPSYTELPAVQLAEWILRDRLRGADADPAAQSAVGQRARSMTARRAIVLLSGGLDSATTLAIARDEGFRLHALSFRYGQRHAVELEAAARVAKALGAVEHRSITIDLAAFGGSALTDHSIAVPETPSTGIPITYVPARNTIFLSYALGWAEVLGARDIFVGVNAVDYSGYPDCRPEFIAAFEQLANLATKAAVEGDRVPHPRAADRMDEGRHHRARNRCGNRLLDDRVVLSARCERTRVWTLRFVSIAARRFVAAGVADPTRYQ